MAKSLTKIRQKNPLANISKTVENLLMMSMFYNSWKKKKVFLLNILCLKINDKSFSCRRNLHRWIFFSPHAIEESSCAFQLTSSSLCIFNSTVSFFQRLCRCRFFFVRRLMHMINFSLSELNKMQKFCRRCLEERGSSWQTLLDIHNH